MPFKQLRTTVEVGSGAAQRADRTLERSTEQTANKVSQTRLDVDEILLKCKETGINNLSVVKSRLADMKVSVDASLMVLGPQVTASLMGAIQECQTLVGGAYESQKELQYAHKIDRAASNDLVDALKHQVQSLQAILGQQVKAIQEVAAQADQLDHLICWCKSVVLRVMAERLRWQQNTGGVALHEARAGDSAASFVERCRSALSKLDDTSNHVNSREINQHNQHLVIRGPLDTAEAVADRFFARVEAKRPEAFVSTKEEIGLLRELLNVTLSETEKDFLPVEAPRDIITRPQLAHIHREVTLLGSMNRALRQTFVDEMRHTAGLFHDLSRKSDHQLLEFSSSQRNFAKSLEADIRAEHALRLVVAKKDVGVQTTSISPEMSINSPGRYSIVPGVGGAGAAGVLAANFLSKFSTTNGNGGNNNNQEGGEFNLDSSSSAAKPTPAILLAIRNNKKINGQLDDDFNDDANNNNINNNNNNNNINSLSLDDHQQQLQDENGGHQTQQQHKPKPPSNNNQRTNSISSTTTTTGNGSSHRRSVSFAGNNNNNGDDKKRKNSSSPGSSRKPSIMDSSSTSNHRASVAFGSSSASRKQSEANTDGGSKTPGSASIASTKQQPWKWVPDTKKVVKILLAAQQKQAEKEKMDELKRQHKQKLAEEKAKKQQQQQAATANGENNNEDGGGVPGGNKSATTIASDLGNNDDVSNKSPTSHPTGADEQQQQQKEVDQKPVDPATALDNRVNDILKKLLSVGITGSGSGDNKDKLADLVNKRKSNKNNNNNEASEDNSKKVEGGENGNESKNNNDTNDENKPSDSSKQQQPADDDETTKIKDDDDDNNNDQVVLDIVKEFQQSFNPGSSKSTATSNNAGASTSLTTSQQQQQPQLVLKDWGKWKYGGHGVAASNPPPRPPPIDISWIKNFVEIANRKGVIVSPENLLQEFVNSDGLPIILQQQNASSKRRTSQNNNNNNNNNNSTSGPTSSSASRLSNHHPHQSSSKGTSGELPGEIDGNGDDSGILDHQDGNNKQNPNASITDDDENQNQANNMHFDDSTTDDHHHFPPVNRKHTANANNNASSTSTTTTTGRHHLKLNHNNNLYNNSSLNDQQHLNIEGNSMTVPRHHLLEHELMRAVSERPPIQDVPEGPSPFDAIPSAIIGLAQAHSASHADRAAGVSYTRTRFAAGGGIELEMPTIDIGRTLEAIEATAAESTVRMLERRTDRQNRLTDATSTRLKDAIHIVEDLEKKSDALVTRYVMGADKVREQQRLKKMQRDLLMEHGGAQMVRDEDNEKDGKMFSMRTAKSSSPLPNRKSSSNGNKNRKNKDDDDNDYDPSSGTGVHRIGKEEAPRTGRLPKASRLFAKTVN